MRKSTIRLLTLFAIIIAILVYLATPKPGRPYYEATVVFLGYPDTATIVGPDLEDCPLGKTILVREIKDDTDGLYVWWYEKSYGELYGIRNRTIWHFDSRTKKEAYTDYRICKVLEIRHL